MPPARKSNAAGKRPAAPQSPKKVFQMNKKPKKVFPESPNKTGNTDSFFLIYPCRHTEDSKWGKKNDLTGNIMIKLLPAQVSRNEGTKKAVELKALREHVRWNAELGCYIVRCYTIEQARLMFTKFIEINPDCDPNLDEEAWRTEKPVPVLNFNTIKEMTIASKTESVIIVNGDTWQMDAPLKQQGFLYNKELQAMALIFEGEAPEIDVTFFEEYGWQTIFEEFETAE